MWQKLKRTYNTTVISIVESSVQWCNLVLHFVTNIMIWTKLSEVSTWKFRDSYVSWFIIISVNCFHDAANRDPKLLHFKYHYPVFYRLHSQIRSHSLTQSHMKDNDMRNLAGFLFSMIIHFHHCYIKISYTVKQAYKIYFILYCVDLYVSLCQSVTLFLFMYMHFFILSLHWKYTICILVNIIRETNPICLCYK
jgi:hypothetical protein